MRQENFWEMKEGKCQKAGPCPICKNATTAYHIDHQYRDLVKEHLKLSHTVPDYPDPPMRNSPPPRSNRYYYKVIDDDCPDYFPHYYDSNRYLYGNFQ